MVHPLWMGRVLGQPRRIRLSKAKPWLIGRMGMMFASNFAGNRRQPKPGRALSPQRPLPQHSVLFLTIGFSYPLIPLNSDLWRMVAALNQLIRPHP